MSTWIERDLTCGRCGLQHRVRVARGVHVGRAPQAEQGDDNREARCRFGRGERHDEKHENLGLGPAVDSGEGDEREIPRVQHQFDAHEDRDRAAAGQDPDDAQCQEDRGQYEHHARVDHDSFLFASSTAPIIATTSRSEIASNG